MQKKSIRLKSYHYLTVDGKDVDSQAKMNNISNTDIKVTMVLPKQNKNGAWLAYGFTSREALNAFIEKDKQRLQNKVNTMGNGAPVVPISMSLKIKEDSTFIGDDGFKILAL